MEVSAWQSPDLPLNLPVPGELPSAGGTCEAGYERDDRGDNRAGRAPARAPGAASRIYLRHCCPNELMMAFHS